jgi:hypothetical protein
LMRTPGPTRRKRENLAQGEHSHVTHRHS